MFQCYKINPYFLILVLFLFLEGCSIDPSFFEDETLENQTKIPEIISEKKIDEIIVQKGDTLFSISKKYNISVNEIIQFNNLSINEIIFEGQIIKIPKIKNNVNNFLGNNYEVANLALPKLKPKSLKTNKLDISFSLPLNGEIINKFGSNSDGIMHEGINISADYGAIVKASANGEVIFVGSNLKDFGTMLLIKHNNQLVSSYAHLSKAYVNEGDLIVQGQSIGEVGSSGKVTKPQLYFEIRKNNEPLNPENFISS